MDIKKAFKRRLNEEDIIWAETIGKLPTLCDILNCELNEQKAVFATQVIRWVYPLINLGPELCQYITGAGDRHGGLKVMPLEEAIEKAYGDDIEFHRGKTEWKAGSEVIYKSESDLVDWVKGRTKSKIAVKLLDNFQILV